MEVERNMKDEVRYERQLHCTRICSVVFLELSFQLLQWTGFCESPSESELGSIEDVVRELMDSLEWCVYSVKGLRLLSWASSESTGNVSDV